MKKQGRILLLAGLAWMGLKPQAAMGQDFTLSQFQAFGQVFNPACIGRGQEEVRVASAYRNQWFASGFPYQTVVLSGEYRYNLLPKKLKQMAYALSFADDQAGAGQWRNTWISLGLSATKSLDDARRHSLSLGMSSALLLRQFNARNLIFENQFESSSFSFNPEIVSGENLGPVRQGFFQVNTGLLYQFAFSDRLSFGLGGSGLWLYRPSEALSNLTTDDKSARLNRRFVTQLYAAYAVSPRLSLEPQVFFSHQGRAREWNLGTWLVFTPDRMATREAWKLGLGLFSRLGDSVIPALRIGKGAATAQISALRIGKGAATAQISYDATFSGAQQGNAGKTFAGVGGMGALEFSFVYAFNLKASPLQRLVVPCQTF